METADNDDLTETRERLSAALGGSDALLRALDLHSKVSVTDSAGLIIDVNDNFCRITGYTRDELLGSSHSILSSAVHPAEFWSAMWRVIAAGDPWRGEICNRAKNGSLHWTDCMIAPIGDAAGRPVIYISIRNDITASKLTEQRLRASEAFLDRTGQTAEVGGWEVDVATNAVQWSAQMMRIHEVDSGYRPTLDAGLQFHPPRARAKLNRALHIATRTGKGWDLELPLITGRGRTIWVRTVCQTEFEAGRPARLVGSMQDITGRKRTEASLAHERARMVSLLAELQEANSRFSIASEAAGIAIWDFNVVSGEITWDERMYRVYGLDPATDKPTFQTWIDALVPDDRARCEAEVKRALDDEVQFDTEFRIARSNGEIRYLQAAARVLRDPAGTALRMTGVNIDVTEAKHAQMQLFKTSSMLRTVLDSAAEIAIIATSPDLTIKVFNAGAERLLGYSSEQVVDHATPVIVHDRDELRELCDKVGAELGRPFEGWEVFVQPSMLDRPRECTFVRQDGQTLKVSQIVTAMHSYEGELLGYLSVGHDVTQQRGHERSLREATQRAEQANRAKSMFLANMSHEIRTPLNAVIGLTYLLGRTDLDEKQTGFLGNIKVASKSLLAIINDVLDLSKIEAGELMVEQTPFRPQDLVDEVVGVMKMHADAKGIGFEVHLPEDLPFVLAGDPTRVKQILTNLISNAIRFTDHGGVELRVRREADQGEEIVLSFIVKDTGIGIRPEAQARLFAPFAQADASITRRYGGTGLGLSIVKSLVAVLGGTLALESSAGVGSEFTVRLAFSPATSDPTATLPAQAATYASGHPGLPGLRVLVVDDSDINLDVVKYILELEGATVALARNGQEAFDRLQADAYEFDIVLMDVQMPGLGGHEATRLIRKELGLIDLPIIALTAGALSSERDRALASGMDDFLIKPFDPATFVRCIRRHVRVASSRSATPVAPQTAPIPAPQPWPQVDGIDSVDARARLRNDVGLFLSSLARLLVEFAQPTIADGTSEPTDLLRQAERMHKLKGTAGMLGARAIHVLAAEAEAACLVGNAGRAIEIGGTLASHLKLLRDSATPIIKAARAHAEVLPGPTEGDIAPHLISELIHLLRQRNLSALDRFRYMEPQLRGHLGDTAFHAVREHIDALQFHSAAEILDATDAAGQPCGI